MVDIRPKDLPAAATVTNGVALIIDNGVNVEKSTPMQIVDAAIPLASQAEAEAGTDNAKRVTPLRVVQYINAQLGGTSLSTAFSGKANASALGVSGSAADMGTFTGSIIPDAQTAKQALQALETGINYLALDSFPYDIDVYTVENDPTGGGPVAAQARVIDSEGTHTKPRYGNHIHLNSDGSGIAAGPASADFGMGVSVFRNDWQTNDDPGEIEGIGIIAVNGVGDVAGLLLDVGTRTGFSAVLEGASRTYLSDGDNERKIRVQAGVVDNVNDAHYGFVAVADNGDCGDGIYVGETSGEWTNLARLTADSAERFVIQRDGTILSNGEEVSSDAGLGRSLSYVSVKSFGAVGDGVNDDTDAINDAIAYCVANGGGTAFMPAGDYLVSDSNPGAVSWDNNRAIYIGGSNVKLCGAGRASTKVTLANGGNCHVVKIGQRETSVVVVDNVEVTDFEIDGNRANQSLPTDTVDHWQGVDISSNCTNVHIRDMIIHDTQYYGIGGQREGIKYSSISDCLIYNTGDDLIDWKNDDGTGNGNSVTNVAGFNCALATGLTGQKAAFDFRSGIFWQNLTFTGTSGKADTVGLRVQVDADFTDVNIPNFPTRGIGATLRGTAGAGSYGVRFSARATKAAGISATGFEQAYRVSAAECGISRFYFYNNVVGIYLADSGTAKADLHHADNGEIRSNTTAGVVVYDGVTDASFNVVHNRSNGIGYDLRAASNNTHIRDGSCTGNTTNLSDLGSATIVTDVSGLRTADNPSNTFAIDSTGTKTVTIAHGLGVTPSKADVSLSIEQNTAVSDWSYNTLKVISADAANIVGSVFVSTASATGSATAIMRAKIRAKSV